MFVTSFNQISNVVMVMLWYIINVTEQIIIFFFSSSLSTSIHPNILTCVTLIPYISLSFAVTMDYMMTMLPVMASWDQHCEESS